MTPYVSSKYRNITVTRLKHEFGWTDRLIAQHLGHSDFTRPNPHSSDNPPMRLFSIPRINAVIAADPQLAETISRNILQRTEFRERIAAFNITGKQEILNRLTDITLPVAFNPPNLDTASLISLAVQQRNEYIHTQHIDAAPLADEDTAQTRGLAVSLLRHQYSNYEDAMVLLPQTGHQDTDLAIYQAVKSRYLRCIAQRFPELRESCQRQLDELQDETHTFINEPTPPGQRP